MSDNDNNSTDASSEINIVSDRNREENLETRLDLELEIVRKMRQAFASSLVMLEAARDDLKEVGERMDDLRSVSQACRTTLLKRQQQQQQQQQQEDSQEKRAATR